ncbi:hypothetical protein A0H81_10437 [Grifola frondosa]|uniref:Uncharacterized protein n=1 Tax=Grifola frondosa TaxID=5627 RepID=A0A1C7LZ82_GRIFR|nr:hypothetical protein A0H81_10437 [Grifola frondosa]
MKRPPHTNVQRGDSHLRKRRLDSHPIITSIVVSPATLTVNVAVERRHPTGVVQHIPSGTESAADDACTSNSWSVSISVSISPPISYMREQMPAGHTTHLKLTQFGRLSQHGQTAR